MTTQTPFPCVTKQQLLILLEKYSLQNNQQILKAIAFSEQIHQHQKRDSGNSYLEEHIYPLIINLINHQKNHPQITTMIIIGLLHDTIENGDIKEGSIAKLFDQYIENYVLCLSKKKHLLSEKPTQEWLFNETKISLNTIKDCGEIPIIVKLEDRLQNLESIININPNKLDKYKRMISEVLELFIPLTILIKPSFDYKSQFHQEISRINKLFPHH